MSVGNRENALKMRPFLSYYGGKWKAAGKHYAPPRYSTIVEPFAGGAGYSVRHNAARVVLVELNPVVAGVWRYLINVNARELLAIPDVPDGGTIDDMGLCQEARDLVGFWTAGGVVKPRRKQSPWATRHSGKSGKFWGASVRERLARQLQEIRHWEVRECSYADADDIGVATWFVDPPYQVAGKMYPNGSGGVDFASLAGWCRELRGQIIVCEAVGAEWLPFEPLYSVAGVTGKPSREAVWTSDTL